MLAAAWAKVPTVIHDQNAVLGRANRFLAPRVDRIAVSVAGVGGDQPFASRIVVTGNPVRPAVIAAAATPYPRRAAEEPFRLLAFGGSQGARFLSEVVPAAVSLMTADIRQRLHIVQQCRPEDIDGAAAAYRKLKVAAELKPFFADMPAQIAASHLIVSRSGASTTAELAVIGRPAVMIPLPNALDQDQKANAQVLAGAGGGWMMEQRDLSPARLAGEIMRFVREPERLEQAAAAARSIGRADAVDRLADLVEQVARERRERPAARTGQSSP
jgi:UDP-N-acetylglucosamine--N-acetylmuramyl-(pentapeptide) pyrophosphoryl-undecaprenol N-acetylglucosamine transferase